jgi:hypothetical protein
MSIVPLEFLPSAGFANRLRALVSAMCVAEDIQSPLQVLWSHEPYVHTSQFRTLFDTESLPSWLKVNEAVLAPHTGWKEIKEILTQDDWNFWLDRMGSKRPIRIKSHAHFYNSDPQRWLGHLRSLKPNVVLAAKRDILFHSLSDSIKIVGVHIRRGDNKKSIKESPSELFWETMRSYDPSVLFYLATDSVEERAKAMELFPKRILVGASILDRNDPLSGSSLMMDFICLSSCSEILGSYYSSFSEMAAMYGGIELRIVKKA